MGQTSPYSDPSPLVSPVRIVVARGRRCSPARLRRIKLHGLRYTSVNLMLDRGTPVHIVAGWDGHDPVVSLSIYSDAKVDELRAAGTSLFG